MPSTLLELRTQARQRADMENSEFVEDSELNTYINDSLSELYDILVARFNDYFVEDPLVFTLATGVTTYNLPANFYKLIGMDRSISGSGSGDDDWYVIKPFNFQDRNSRRRTELFRGIYPNVEYRLLGDLMRFTPADQAPGMYRMWYNPSCPALVDDADEIGIQIDRWKIYIVVDAAIKMLQKEESDVTVLLNQKAALTRRIQEMSQNRDAGESERVTDVSLAGNDDPLYYRY